MEMKRLLNDRLVLGMLVLTILVSFGTIESGHYWIHIIESSIFFIPGLLLLALIKRFRKKRSSDKGAIAAGVIYPFAVWITIYFTLYLFNLYAVYDLFAMILLGCMAHRVFKYGSLLLPLPERMEI